MSGNLRISMLIEANAARAKAEVASFREETVRLAQAGETAKTGMASAEAGTAEWGSAVQLLRAALHPVVDEAHALIAASDQLAFAEEAGALSAREAALAHDMLARAAIELQDRMDAMGVTLDGSTVAMTRHESAVQQLIARNTGLQQSEQGSIAAHLQHGQSLDQLRARFNPLFAASRLYELALGEIAEAERLGAISAMEAAAARERAAGAMAPASAQMVRFGRDSAQSSQHVMQLGYQLNDIGMMMAMGQSPFMLMMQQGPQVVQVFAEMRAQGVALGTTLRSSFAMFLNPMSLATMAVIGFGAAAVQWLVNTEAQAEGVRSAFEAIGRATADMQTEIDKLNFGVDEQYEVELLREQMSLRDEYNTKLAEARRIAASFGDDERARAQYIADTNVELSGITARYNEISGLIADQQNRSTQLAIIEGIRAQQAGEIAARQEEAAAEAAVLADESVRAGLAASGLSLVDFGNLEGGAEAALRMAGNLGIAYNEAVAMGNMLASMTSGDDERGSQREMVRGANTRKPNQPWLETYTRGGWIDPTKGGGGGGGKSEAEKQTEALKSLRQEQERQIALLRATDPVQRIILENHEALAKATAAEKEEVVGLILERERLEALKETVDNIGQTLGQAFVSWTSGASSFSDALSGVLERLAEMAASSVWDMIWDGTGNGDSGLGGLIAEMLGLPVKADGKADGGRITGPGGPRDDKVLTWTSNGEYVVNARSTAENLPFLEAINNGASLSDILAGMTGARPIALADGGYVGDWNGSSAPRSWLSNGTAGRGASEGAGGGRQAPVVQIVNQSREPIRQVQGDGPDAEGTIKLIVGRQMAGGQYDKQNRARYGVGPEVARR